MEVVNNLFLFNLIMASLMVASLASPLAEEYLRANEQKSAFGKRHRFKLREFTVKPAIFNLKNYTQEQREVVVEPARLSSNLEEQTSAFGRRERLELRGFTVKPLIEILKDYTQKDVEYAANFLSAVFCHHKNEELQKKYSGAYMRFRECMREERGVIPTLKEIDGILMKEPYEPEDTVAGLRSYCKVSTKIFDCLDPFITAMKACLGGGMEHRWRAHRLGRLRPMSDFICSNEDNRTISFFNDNILECADKKTELLRNCTEDFRSYQRFIVECRKMPEVKKCFTDTLEKCEKPSTSGYFKDLYEIFLTDYPCVSNNSTI